MLDTLKWELDQALLVGTCGKTITFTVKWDLALNEIDEWYADMIEEAESCRVVLSHVLTFFEGRPVAFYLDGSELSMMDLTDTEKIHLN